MRRMMPYLLLLPALVAGVSLWRSESGRRAALDRVAQLEAELNKSKASPAVTAPPETEEGAATATAETKVVRVPTGTDPAPYIKTIDELREQVQALSRDVSAARDETAKAEARAVADAADAKQSRAQMDDLREDMQAARRLSDAVQAELKVKSDRLVRAETAVKVMQERASRAEAAASKVSTASKEIEDLNQRREAYLSTLLRRYREVNDLYRNFALNAQTREVQGTGLQAGDLSRIQSTIQQAEDDLRQLQTLNARAAQLARAK